MNEKTGEVVFATLGYAIFMWLWHKLVRNWATNTKDKTVMLLRCYVCFVLAMPTAFFVIYCLGYLYNVIY